jgi:hypothetical protein
LSPAAVALLRNVQALNLKGELVFPSLDKAGQPLSSAAMAAVIKRINRDRVAQGLAAYVDPKERNKPASVHGMRALLKTWASDCTDFRPEVSDAALAHKISDKVLAAYQRGELLEKRRRLMAAWARFLAKPAAAAEGGKIVALVR